MTATLVDRPLSLRPCLIALTLLSIISEGATTWAPALAYATAMSASLWMLLELSSVPVLVRIP